MNLEKILGSMVLGLVKSLTAAGVEQGLAMRLASFILIENALGREGTTAAGVAPTTARRWRRILRELELEPDQETQGDIENQIIELLTGIEDLARDGRVAAANQEIEEVMKEKGWS